MIPVVPPAEMAAVDAAAVDSLEQLIARAGWIVAREALAMLGGAYGRRVHVIAGPGNNGADGRVACEVLRGRGVRVSVGGPRDPVRTSDLVIDAAFGTGLNREYVAPPLPVPRPLILAVDCPSGLDGLTGERRGTPWRADRTVTFGALKPGLLFGVGPELCGTVVVESLDLDVSRATCHLAQHSELATLLPRDADDVHKWQRAGLLFAGSPGMSGAAELAASAAMRSGVRYLRVVSSAPADRPIEAVGVNGEIAVPTDIDRFHAVAIGPGIGTNRELRSRVASVVEQCRTTVIVDADALNALGSAVAAACRTREVPAILTPHDGEFVRLAGSPVGLDRVSSARGLAAATGAVVLLKGPTTVVANPSGDTRLIAHGDHRLATAGSGDVLTGILLGIATSGLAPYDVATAGAILHASLVAGLPPSGVIASDLIGEIANLLA